MKEKQYCVGRQHFGSRKIIKMSRWFDTYEEAVDYKWYLDGEDDWATSNKDWENVIEERWK